MPSWLLKPLAWLGGIAVVIGAAFLKGYSVGRKLVQTDQMKDTLEKGRKHRARKSTISRLSNDKLAKRLREWERK